MHRPAIVAADLLTGSEDCEMPHRDRGTDRGAHLAAARDRQLATLDSIGVTHGALSDVQDHDYAEDQPQPAEASTDVGSEFEPIPDAPGWLPLLAAAVAGALVWYLIWAGARALQ